MNIISRKTIADFFIKYPEAEQSLLSWYHEAKNAEWETPHDIKSKYGGASILKGNIVIFNIKGNNFRLAVKVNYKAKIVYIKWFGTHKDYDKVNFNGI